MRLAATTGKRGGPNLIDMANAFDEGPRTAMAMLKIRAADHGVRNGWFEWPVNFDPIWLESCTGFEKLHGGR